VNPRARSSDAPPVDRAATVELLQGVVDCISEAELLTKLASGRPLRIKLGIDPTASDLHLGFAVVLRKLRQFQDHGHVAVLILGDYTAQVGDPSGRDQTRPRLSAEEVDAHAKSYLEQLTTILDPDPARLEVRRNSEWLATMGTDDVLELTSATTVARMLERDDFARRYAEGAPITLTEFLYPLLQGRDSVVVEADVELGGTDQLFNLLVGRQLQSRAGQEPQVVITTPLLPGLGGGPKMSKSLGNYVGVDDAPADMFGKLMSIPDDLLPEYLQLTTAWPQARVEEATATLPSGPAARAAAKRLLGRTVVDLYHGDGAGEQAEAEFDRVFREGAAPSDLPEHRLDRGALDADGTIRLVDLLFASGLVASKREAGRVIDEGGVRVAGVRAADREARLSADDLDGVELAVGKRRWVRVVLDG
jgi:tyrosyl-tRNA synthetase